MSQDVQLELNKTQATLAQWKEQVRSHVTCSTCFSLSDLRLRSNARVGYRPSLQVPNWRLRSKLCHPYRVNTRNCSLCVRSCTKLSVTALHGM